jgi:hypothetical protein
MSGSAQLCSRCSAAFVKPGRVPAKPLCNACRMQCADCGRPKRTRHSSLCRKCAGPAVGAGGVVSLTTRYADDNAAQAFVARFAQGASQDAVAEAMGISRGLVAYIESQALAHMRARLRLVGIEAGDIIAKPEHPLAGTWGEEECA